MEIKSGGERAIEGGGKQERLKEKAGRHRMTVTAQLMMGHEMALPLIMIERTLERRTEREAGRQREREGERQ